ncbi:MAG: hypothetical protein EHM59_22430 [Betaproteobacteria bacterium]|nr:MAG: hypothetical protein EHM59_22430 [Betaproteobacteria bacterium]
MRYTIVAGPRYIKAEMVERDSAEETKEFAHAILDTLRKHTLPRVLISIRSSRPVYKVDTWNLNAALDQLVGLKGLRVAFIADSKELAMSQEYIALLARQRGLDFRLFPAEKEAAEWLTDGES